MGLQWLSNSRWLICWLVPLWWCCGMAEYIKFKPGYSYVYTLNSTIEMKHVETFLARAKIAFVNINDSQNHQELLLIIHEFSFMPQKNTDVRTDTPDISKWFSFEITRQGVILLVYHPEDEDDEILSVKKGFAAMLSGKLHKQEEVEHSVNGPDDWEYLTDEHGYEGHHKAKYKVKSTPEGHRFSKTRESDHPVPNAKSRYLKELHFHAELGTIHRVMVEEEFVAPTTAKKGFDPNVGMRPVQAVNQFSKIAYPEMKAFARDELKFLTRERLTESFFKPLMLQEGHIAYNSTGSARRNKCVDLDKMSNFIYGNLTCIRKEPEKGTPKLSQCFHGIVDSLKKLCKGDLDILANMYFKPSKKVRNLDRADASVIMDAFYATNSPAALKCLVVRILNNSESDEAMINRLLSALVVLDQHPIPELIDTLEKHFETSKFLSVSRETHHSFLLATGGIIDSLNQHSDREKAHQMISRLHDMIGLHDPWVWRMRRATMTKEEQNGHDHDKVILLDALGNAGLDISYEFIISNLNTTNSQWVKRSAIHALRVFNHERALNDLKATAMFDDNELVRYEAMLQYQKHPLSVYNNWKGEKAIDYVSKRGVLDFLNFEIKFRLEAPGVDWVRKIGSEDIGASFGVIMENLLDLKIALLNGHLMLNVHDEAFVRVHLGILNRNYVFFEAGICFKGRTEYSINILKDLNLEKLVDMVVRFKDIVGRIVDAVTKGVNFLKKLLSAGYIKNLVDEFVSSVRNIPTKVTNLAPVIRKITKAIGKYKVEGLPAFLQPVKKLINMVIAFYEKIKNDVMTFYYSIVEAVEIKIPQAANQMFEAIQGVVGGFVDLFDDPKSALAAIGKGVITAYTTVKDLNETKNEIMSHTFIKDGIKVYWMDLKDDLEEIKDQFLLTVKSITSGKDVWVKEVMSLERDPIAEFTNGKQSLATVRQKIADEIKAKLDELMEPFDVLVNVGTDFYNAFMSVFDTIKDIKEAFRTLKEGYHFARTLISQIFGPKFHKDFPKTLRTTSGGCSGTGVFPSNLGGGKTNYDHEGIDILAEKGARIVAPMSGSVVLTGKENEAMIIHSGDLPPSSELIITNIVPAADIKHPHDSFYVEKLVGKGELIGTVSQSPCDGMNHIHVSIRKGAGYIDPSKYLEKRPLVFPEWIQECDDYKLVFKNKVVKAGVIAGLGGQENKDLTENVPKEETPQKMDASDQPGTDILSIKDDPTKIFSKIPADWIGEQNTGSPDSRPSGSGINFKGIGASVGNLLRNIKSFLKKFSIRRIKLGQVIDFLDTLDMHKSKQAMGNLLKTIIEAINQKPCENPYQMTDEELEVELMNRGLEAKGTREDMVKTLTTLDSSCPLLTLTMPDLGGLYCRMDDMCLGIECCLTIEMLGMFQKTFRAFARFDPVDFTLSVGFESWKYTFEFKQLIPGFDPTNLNYATEKEVKTGVRFDILDGDEIIVKYALQLSPTEMVLSFGAGVCSSDDSDKCLVFLYLLEDAVFPLPIVHVNGTITWPEVNWKEYFSKEAIQKRLREAGTELATVAVDVAFDQFLESLGLNLDILANRPPCPREENYELIELKELLEARRISTEGSETELRARYFQSDQTCTLYNRTVTLPDISNTAFGQYLYFYISDDCMRLDACLDVRIPGTDISKSFAAFISLDPCNFVISAAFERWSLEPIILFEYDWGKQEEVRLTNDIFLRFSIDKDDENKMFVISMSIKFSDVFDGDLPIANNLELPVPLCNQELNLLENIKDLAKALGGEINNAVFDLLLGQLGIDTILIDGPCELPKPPEGCPEGMDPDRMIPESMKKYLKCSLADNCFGLSCCLQFSFTIPLSSLERHLSVPFWFEMDPCELSFFTGIGTYQHHERLLHYNWDEPGELLIGNRDNPPITVRYRIKKQDLNLIVDLTLSICLPIAGESVCIPEDGIILLDRESIPACNLTAIVNASKSNFSLGEWLKEKGEDITTELSEAGLEAIIKTTGIGSFLNDKKCDRRKEPYSPSVLNWNNRCNLSFVGLPELPEMISCYIPEHCTAIYCCVDIPKIGLSINAFLDIDLCSYKLSGGIERETFDVTMFNYEWGKPESLSILGLLDLKYSIKKPPNKKIFIMDLVVGVCFENDGSCLIEVPLMEGSEVPQPGCDLSASFNFKEFSLSTLLSNNGLTNITSSSDIWGEVLDFVTEILGLNDFFLDVPCERTLSTYSPSDDRGWKNDCTRIDFRLPSLPNILSCALKDSCTAIDCCSDVQWLRRRLQMSFNIDYCDFTISGNLEKLSFNISVIDFEFNVPAEETIKELLKIRYTIGKTAKDFIVDLGIAVCMESGQPCQFEIDIFKKVRVPIPICNTDMSFKIEAFSLTSYMEDKGQDVLQSLSSAMINTLLHDLGLDKYLKNPQCDRMADVYENAVNGWNSECNISLPLPKLPDDIRCHIPDYCTGIQCCVYVGLIKRSFNFKVLIDCCMEKITVSIERMSKTIMYHNYDYEGHVYLGGVVRVNFKIINLESAKQYIVDLSLSVCFGENNCVFTFDIFENTYLPKPFCNWNNGFKIPDLTISGWLALKGSETFEDYLVEVLLEELGILQYMREKPCSRNKAPFVESVGGWVNNCSVDVDLPPISGPLTCYVPSYCSGISCCIDVDIISRTFNAYLLLDTCTFLLTVGIENFKTEIPLINYPWGKTETFALFGLVNIKYNIVNLSWRKEFVVNLQLSACSDSKTCDLDLTIFRDKHIPNVACDWNAVEGIDISGITQDIGSNIVSGTWPSVLVDNFLEKVGVSQFMKSEQCDMQSNTYKPAINGWKSDCDIQLAALHKYFSCYIPETCTEINCCVHLPILNRNINFLVSLDMFAAILRLGIEDYTEEIILLNGQDWDLTKTFDMFGVFQFSISIENLITERKFIFSLSAAAFPGIADMELQTTIADNLVLPYKNLFELKIPEISFDDIVESIGHAATEILPELVITQVLEELGITPYLKEEQCSHSDSMFANAINGWTKACDVNLPSLPNYIRCNLGPNCTKIQCCLEISKINRAFYLELSMDLCLLEMNFGIENYKNTLSLVEYKQEAEIEFNLRGFLTFSFSLKSKEDRTQNVVTLSIGTCFKLSGSCDTILLLDEADVPDPFCNWTPSFWMNDYSLETFFSWDNIQNGLLPNELDILRYLDAVGISKFLQEQPCLRDVYPFAKREPYWTNLCSIDVAMSNLPDSVSCVIEDFCTGITCCAEIAFLKRGISAYAWLDYCSGRLVVGVENYKKNISLASYKFGTRDSLILFGLVRIEYEIYSKVEDRAFVMSVDLKLCFKGDACEFQHTIMDNAVIPYPICKLDADFLDPDFSLTAFMDSLSLEPSLPLPVDFLDDLMDTLGVSSYLLETACQPNRRPFVRNGWNKECRMVGTLPHLPNSLSCHLPSSCDGFQCCINVESVSRTFYVAASIDMCSYKLTVTLENLKYELFFSDHSFQEELHIYLYGIVRLTLQINQEGEMFRMAARLQICFEAHGVCIFDAPVLSDIILKPDFCKYGFGFFEHGFAFEKWLQLNSLDIKSLSTVDVNAFLSQLQLTPYLNGKTCNATDSDYLPITNGWKADSCPSAVTAFLPSLPPNVVCFFDNACKKIGCCIDLPTLRKSFHFSLHIDTCRQKLELDIEAFHSEIIFADFDFGTFTTLKLQGFLQNEFRVIDMQSVEAYMIDMNLKVCFSDSGSCEIEIPVLVQQHLPKLPCSWTEDLIIAGE